jgi:hypothetical protein
MLRRVRNLNHMKKIVLAIVLLISLKGAAQRYIQSSIQQGSTSNSADITFLPNYSSGATEYVNYLSLSIAIPTASAAGVVPALSMKGPFTGMAMVPAIPFSYVSCSGSETIYSWVYSSGPSSMTWTAGIPFTGATVSFTGGTGSANIRLVDYASKGGGDNSNTLFVIVTNVDPYDVANYSNLFYAIGGANGSTTGTNPCGDPYIQTNLPIFLSSFCQAPAPPNVAGITTTSSNITWTAVPGVSGYEYELSTSQTPTSPISTTSLSFSPTGLTEGTTYYFNIRSVCSTGNYSGWTQASFATICPAATSITVDSITPSGAKIKWQTVAGAGQGYQYAVTSGIGAPSPTAIKSTLSDSAVVSGLTEGTTYYAQVRVNCSPGIYSQWISQLFTTTYPPCNIPASLNASVLNDKADISWTPPVSGGVGYEVAVTTSSSFPVSGAFTSSTSYSVSGLSSNTRYYIYVRTQCGTGQYSGWITQTFITNCYKPIIYFVKNLPTLGAADLGWHSVKGALKYEYAVLNKAAPPPGSINFTPDTIIHTSGLVAGNKYYLHVRTYCSFTSISDWSTQEFYASGLSIYSNSSNIFTITSYGADIQNDEIVLFDGAGKLIKTIKLSGSTLNINMQSFASGIYYLRFGKNRRYLKKIIKL